jgi:hypothetical protein
VLAALKGRRGSRRVRSALRRRLPRRPVELGNVATPTSAGNGAKWTVRGMGAVGTGGGRLLGTLRDVGGVTGKPTLRAGSAPGGCTALGCATSEVGVVMMLRVGTTGRPLVGALASVGGETTVVRRSARRRRAS